MQFPEYVLDILKLPIDPAAVSMSPRGFSSIKSIYITERLNQAFGLGRWFVHDTVVQVQPSTVIIKKLGAEEVEVTVPGFVVIKATLELADYPWFRASAYGGNNNEDLGDAYKGAVTDAISKMCAVYLGIAADVFKGPIKTEDQPLTPKQESERTAKMIEEAPTWDALKDLYSSAVRTAKRNKVARDMFTSAYEKAKARLA